LNNVPAGLKYKERLENLINNNKIPKREKKLEVKKLLYQMTSSDLAKTFVELLKKKQLIVQKGGNEKYNILADANTPVDIVKQKVRTMKLYHEILIFEIEDTQ
jgi:RNase P/RNase MRP subunit p30